MLKNLPDNLITDEILDSGFKGLFVGGCIAHGEGSSFRHKAHAHCFPEDKYFGWICIRSAKRLTQKNLLIHELAHILTRNGHTKKFYQCVRRLGGSITRDDRRIASIATRGL